MISLRYRLRPAQHPSTDSSASQVFWVSITAWVMIIDFRNVPKRNAYNVAIDRLYGRVQRPRPDRDRSWEFVGSCAAAVPNLTGQSPAKLFKFQQVAPAAKSKFFADRFLRVN